MGRQSTPLFQRHNQQQTNKHKQSSPQSLPGHPVIPIGAFMLTVGESPVTCQQTPGQNAGYQVSRIIWRGNFLVKHHTMRSMGGMLEEQT